MCLKSIDTLTADLLVTDDSSYLSDTSKLLREKNSLPTNYTQDLRCNKNILVIETTRAYLSQNLSGRATEGYFSAEENRTGRNELETKSEDRQRN